MAKIGCPCGHVISTVLFPHPDGRRMLTEEEADGLFGERYEHQGKQFHECPECGRLLFSGEGSGQIVSYVKERKGGT